MVLTCGHYAAGSYSLISPLGTGRRLIYRQLGQGESIGEWRAKLQRSMWPLAVVVGGVRARTVRRWCSPKDQDPVGGFGPGGSDEAFCVAVRSRTSWRDLHGLDAGADEDSVERGGELAGAVADEARAARGLRTPAVAGTCSRSRRAC